MIGIEAARKVVEDILSTAIDASGNLAPDAASLLALRREKTRDTVLRRLVAAVVPRNINPSLWLHWLKGGEEPYSPARLSRAGSDKHASGRILDRASARIETQEERVKRATAQVEQDRRHLAASEKNLAKENQALATAYAMDNAILHWAVSEHLARIIAPVFAMGPAWTLMRICSAHVSEDDIAAEVAEHDPENHDLVKDMLIKHRAEMSQQMLDGLDFWSGHAEFEHTVRLAIDGIVRQFDARDDERIAQREYQRSRDEMASSARPSAALDRDGVLGGFEDN